MPAAVQKPTALVFLATCFAAGLYLSGGVSARTDSTGTAVRRAAGPLHGPVRANARVPVRARAVRVLASNSAVYSDPAGDNAGNSPDITSVSVSNDDAGTVSMSIALPNRATLDADMYIDVYFDSDQNAGTGLSGGADYLLRTVGSESKIYLYACGSSTCDSSVGAPSLTASYSSGLTVHISSADLHATSGFSFYIYTSSCSTTCVQDSAGEWNYQFTAASTTTAGTTTRPTSTTTPSTTTSHTTTGTTTNSRPAPPPPPRPGSLQGGPPPPNLPSEGTGGPPGLPSATQTTATTVQAQSTPNAPSSSSAKLAVVVLTMTPTAPRHGRPFTVRLSVARNDTGAPVTRGTVTCAARVGTRRVTANVHAIVGGRVTCGWKLPSGSRGKRLTASVGLTYGTLRLVRGFSARIL